MEEKINTQGFFFKELFSLFNKARFNYVVLHSWQTLPECATSDVDMLISGDEKKRLPLLLKMVEESTGWRFVQKLWYDVPWCFYYVAVSPDGKASAALDFVSDPTGLGEYRIKDELLLRYREFSGLLYHLSAEMELAYKIAKRRVKGILRDEDYIFLQGYYCKSNKNVLRHCLDELLPTRSSDIVITLLEHEASIDELRKFFAKDSPAFVMFNRRWRVKFGVSWIAETIVRIVDRLRHPTGAIVYLNQVTIDRLGGLKCIENSGLLPHFVFRRQKMMPGVFKLNAKQRCAALSSASLVVAESDSCNGYDVGFGVVEIDSDVCMEVLGALARRFQIQQ